MLEKSASQVTGSTPAERGWSSAPIGSLVVSRVENCPPGGQKFTYVDISSIDSIRKRVVAPKQIATELRPSRARQLLKSRDVIVSMTRPNLNAVAIVPPELDGATGSTGFDVLRAVHIVPEYLYYYVQSPDFVEAMSALVLGVLYPAVRPADIRNHPIPIAPTSE